jgi:hypothetical protein
VRMSGAGGRPGEEEGRRRKERRWGPGNDRRWVTLPVGACRDDASRGPDHFASPLFSVFFRFPSLAPPASYAWFLQ